MYSLAIVLAEEGLLERATIYATDFNDETLAQAREGIYPLDRMCEFTQSYHAADGGRFAEHLNCGTALPVETAE